MATSSTTVNQPRSIAFFGATGGCALATLTRALQSPTSYQLRALARTPQKLTDLLLARQIPQQTLDERLTIIQGNVKDEKAVQQTLTVPTVASNATGQVAVPTSFDAPRIVDMILSGIGAMPILCWGIPPFTMDDGTICQSATATILAALQTLQSEQRTGSGEVQKPLVTVISTTGISKRRDIPWLLVPLYHWFLKVPHEDKKIMEALLAQSEQRHLSVRPTLLLNGPANLPGVRYGYEYHPDDVQAREAGKQDIEPAMGYTITRESVGAWIFETVVEGAREEWEGRMVNLTE
ncbi:MAG: hypothetical protein Q9162_005766 [Coniocarpon cinnabarinum]